MSGAAIVIEIAATDAGSPYAAALVEACTRGSHANLPCVLPNDADASPPAMIAVVTWQDSDHRAVEVQVGAHRASGPEWSTRHLTFAETDAEIERWRAVGLVIATLAGEVSAPNAAPAEAPPAAPTPKPIPAPAARPVEVESRAPAAPAWALQASAEFARGSSSSFGAYGTSLRVSRRLQPRFLFGTASVRYETESTDRSQVELSSTWLTLGVGAALPVARAHLALEARVEPALDVLRASLTNPAPGSGSEGGNLFALREGVGAVWWWAQWFGLAVSADAFEMNRRAVVRAQSGGASRTVAEVQPFGWAATLGIRVGFGE